MPVSKLPGPGREPRPVGPAATSGVCMAPVGIITLAFVARRRHWFGVYVPQVWRVSYRN